jgi:hypothetical protein
MSKLRMYCLFKEDRSSELYLTLPIPRKLKIALARIRTGNHGLEIEIARHHDVEPKVRL